MADELADTSETARRDTCVPQPTKRAGLVSAAILGLSPSLLWARGGPPGPTPPPPVPAPAGVPTIYVQNNSGVLLQVGYSTDAYWIGDNAYNAGRLVRGTYD